MTQPCQWSIEWDDRAGGWRGRFEGLETGSYTGQSAVLRAIESGRISVAGAGSERSEQGLVSCQQSLDASGVRTPETEPKSKKLLTRKPNAAPVAAGAAPAAAPAAAPVAAPVAESPVSKADALARLKRDAQGRNAVKAAKAKEATLARVDAERAEVKRQRGIDPAAATERAERLRAVKVVKIERKGEADAIAKAQAEAPKVPPVKYRGRRWRITLSNGEKTSEVDSLWARMGRCHKRVKAWADAVPHINRRLRRIYKAVSEKTGKEIGPRLVMITLSYGDADTKHKISDGWEPNHIREYMLKLRKQLKAKLWAYGWVAEMQERESLHYHIMVYVAPGTNIPMPDEEIDGLKMWPHGHSKIETAKKGPWYLIKYVGKEHQKEGLPAGARMFAVWIGKKQATAEELLGFRLSAAPPYVQDAIRDCYTRGHVNASVTWGRVKGGGWVIKDLGLMVETDWYLVRMEPIDGLSTLSEQRESLDDVHAAIAEMIARHAG